MAWRSLRAEVEAEFWEYTRRTYDLEQALYAALERQRARGRAKYRNMTPEQRARKRARDKRSKARIEYILHNRAYQKQWYRKRMEAKQRHVGPVDQTLQAD